MIRQFHKRSLVWTMVGFLLLAILGGFAFTKKTLINNTSKPLLTEIVLEIGNKKVVKFNQEAVPLSHLAERLNQFRYDENSIIALKPVDTVSTGDWYEVQWQLQAVPVPQIKYINTHTGASVVTSQYDFMVLHGERGQPNDLRPVQKDEKYGFENRDNVLMIPPRFDQAHSFTSSRAIVKINGKWGAIDRTGKMVIPPQYDQLHSFNEGLAEFKLNGKWGYLNINGDIVIEPQFDNAFLFEQGYATVSIGQKDGVIDRKGQFIIPPIYERLYHFREGLIPAQQNEKWGYLDEKGQIVIDLVYEQTEMFTDGLGLVRTNGRWGYINKLGEFVIQPQYSEANSFQEGLAAVRMANGKYGFIDTNGKTVIPPQFDMAFPFQMGAAMTVIFENPDINLQGQGLTIDKAGNVLTRQGKM